MLSQSDGASAGLNADGAGDVPAGALIALTVGAAATPARGDAAGDSAFSACSAARCASFASRSAFMSFTDMERPRPRPRPERPEAAGAFAGDVGDGVATSALCEASGEFDGEAAPSFSAFSASRCASFASRSAFISLTDIDRPRPRPRPERLAGDFVGEAATELALGDALGELSGDVTIPAAAFSASLFASFASRSAFMSLTDIDRPSARPRGGMPVLPQLPFSFRWRPGSYSVKRSGTARSGGRMRPPPQPHYTCTC